VKHLLALLGSEDDNVGPYARALAREFDAQTTAVAYAFEPSLPYFTTDSLEDVIAQARDGAAQAAAKTLQLFDRSAKQAGLKVVARTLLGTSERVAHETARLARYHDVMLIGQTQGLELERSLLTAALFGSGRPVWVVPDSYVGPAKLSKCLIAWDGRAPAARAVADALLLLSKAKAVQIASVSIGDQENLEADQVDLARHLALHGVTVEPCVVAGTDIAKALLRQGADFGADLLIMGGYGHSRFREFVLGGTTKDILARTTIPVFMAH
jgi:nucleotide-binding universal stress UspA family protein